MGHKLNFALLLSLVFIVAVLLYDSPSVYVPLRHLSSTVLLPAKDLLLARLETDQVPWFDLDPPGIDPSAKHTIWR
jgi:hypothetical protein